jgi:Mg2+-importing ATPase
MCSLAIVALAVAFPFTPLGGYFGFVPPPPSFYAILSVIVLVYLFAVEVVKQLFFRRFFASGKW